MSPHDCLVYFTRPFNTVSQCGTVGVTFCVRKKNAIKCKQERNRKQPIVYIYTQKKLRESLVLSQERTYSVYTPRSRRRSRCDERPWLTWTVCSWWAVAVDIILVVFFSSYIFSARCFAVANMIAYKIFQSSISVCLCHNMQLGTLFTAIEIYRKTNRTYSFQVAPLCQPQPYTMKKNKTFTFNCCNKSV